MVITHPGGRIERALRLTNTRAGIHIEFFGGDRDLSSIACSHDDGRVIAAAIERAREVPPGQPAMAAIEIAHTTFAARKAGAFMIMTWGEKTASTSHPLSCDLIEWLRHQHRPLAAPVQTQSLAATLRANRTCALTAATMNAWDEERA